MQPPQYAWPVLCRPKSIVRATRHAAATCYFRRQDDLRERERHRHASCGLARLLLRSAPGLARSLLGLALDRLSGTLRFRLAAAAPVADSTLRLAGRLVRLALQALRAISHFDLLLRAEPE